MLTPGGDARLHGELPGVEERAVAHVLEDVPDVGEGRLPDPLRALAAHLGERADLRRSDGRTIVTMV